MRIGLRIAAASIWIGWLWLNWLGCGSWAPACRPLNPAVWPVGDVLRLLVVPGLLFAVLWRLTRTQR